MEVTQNGKINGAHEGKHGWHNAFHSLASHHLNMVIVKVNEQNPINMG
jgi:hypothetical protein